MIRLQQSGLDYIISWEEFRAFPYDDGFGNMTIYFGHLILPGEKFNNTQEEGEAILAKDIEITEHAASKMLEVAIDDNQYQAFIDMCYNTGVGRLEHSETLALINSGADKETVAKKIEKAFITSNGIVVGNLVSRRKADADLWRA